jgi:cytoskeleton protein RodZ
MTEEAAAADAGAPAGVGEQLARARSALGLSVADVAQQLKFAQRQIEALEQDRYEQLPAGTFARGMLRAYARLLKLDPEPLVAGISRRVAVPDNAEAVASARRPIPITDNARRTNLIYAGLSLLLLAVVAGVAIEWQRDRSSSARLTFVPAAQAPKEGANVTPGEAPREPAAPGAVAVTAMAVSPGAVAVLEPAPAPAAAPPPAAAGEKPAPGRRRLTLKFERESWVQIRNRDGRVLTSELNPAGSERVVDGLPPFDIVIGNAQHVRLSYDDKPVDLTPYVKVEVARFTLD